MEAYDYLHFSFEKAVNKRTDYLKVAIGAASLLGVRNLANLRIGDLVIRD